ncbi:MAG TPA: DUF167 domain-containing protein [Gemmataceae bacterium]|jgi:hypothetical protein|nr:DUF167 domain-containing protein [Gemmataceae bacterium]
MIAITENAQGCILPVRARPGARTNAVLGEHANALKVAVTAPPENGRANNALIEVLSAALGLKRSQIALLSGHGAREKRFQISGVAKADLEARLAKTRRATNK